MHLATSLPVLFSIALSASAADFKCPPEDIIATKCMGPKDCLYPNPHSCSSFIQCTVNEDLKSGTPVVMPCPAGLEWNDRQKICDWPANSTCRNLVQKIEDSAKEALPPPGGIIDSSFSCANAGCEGIECIYANPANSKSYIQCTAGVAYVLQCEKGGKFSKEVNACEK